MQETLQYRELVDFFQFFQDWFGGTSPNTDDHFSRIFTVIPEDSTFIIPKGELISLTSYISNYRSAHGGVTGIQMWIDKFRLHWERGDLSLVTYEQFSQSPDSEPQGRISTVIFRKKPEAPNGLEWLHVHETLLPVPEA